MADPIIPPESAISTFELSLDQLLAELEALDESGLCAQMPADHPGKRITIHHLLRARSAAEAWLLIAWRFPWLYPATAAAQSAPASLEDVRKLEKPFSASLPPGEGLSPRTPAGNNLKADLAKLLALPPEALTHSNGLVNKSAVARALGRGAGGGQWGYLVEISNYLQAELDVRPDEVQQEAA